MSKRYRGWSDSQANAEALARRSSPYTEANAASWQVRFGHRDQPMTTKALVAQLSEMLAEEVPVRLHNRDLDEGGGPAMTHQFLAYLEGEPMDTTTREPKQDSEGRALRPVFVGTFRKPVQAAIEGMKRCGGKTAWWGLIAERVVIASERPVEAARAEGSHEHEAVRTANEALTELYRRITPDKMDLGRTTTAA